MRRAVICVAAGLAGVAIGVGINLARSATEISSAPTPTAAASRISIWEIHNQAHLEFLPIQQIDDQSLVFTEARRE
jgi:archaellin